MRKVNLSKEESLTIMGYGGTGPELLANETLMRENQVIRSTTNQVHIHYRSLRETNHGVFSLRYQGNVTITGNINRLFYFYLGILIRKLKERLFLPELRVQCEWNNNHSMMLVHQGNGLEFVFSHPPEAEFKPAIVQLQS